MPRGRKIGFKVSEETKFKLSKSLLGKIPWNKGKTKEKDDRILKYSKKLKGLKRSEETKIKISKSKIGSQSWCKGKTHLDDPRIAFGERNGMYGKTHSKENKLLFKELGKLKFGGENNPWFGKDRSGKLSPRWKPESIKRKYKDYQNKVVWLTERTYIKYIKEINPKGLPRTLCGIKGGYQLDHIFPIYKAFLNKWKPEKVSNKNNLQMLSWKENRDKGIK